MRIHEIVLLAGSYGKDVWSGCAWSDACVLSLGWYVRYIGKLVNSIARTQRIIIKTY